MNAHKLGSFVADFLEGFLGDAGPATTAAAGPAVIPMDSIRAAVREVIQPLIDAEDVAQTVNAPTADDLNLYTETMGQPQPADPIAEATLRRVTELHEREAQRARAEQMGVPDVYDPNDPESGKSWMAPHERSSA